MSLNENIIHFGPLKVVVGGVINSLPPGEDGGRPALGSTIKIYPADSIPGSGGADLVDRSLRCRDAMRAFSRALQNYMREHNYDVRIHNPYPSQPIAVTVFEDHTPGRETPPLNEILADITVFIAEQSRRYERRELELPPLAPATEFPNEPIDHLRQSIARVIEDYMPAIHERDQATHAYLNAVEADAHQYIARRSRSRLGSDGLGHITDRVTRQYDMILERDDAGRLPYMEYALRSLCDEYRRSYGRGFVGGRGV